MFKGGQFYPIASSVAESSIAYDSEFHLFRGSDMLLGVNEEGHKIDIQASEEDLHYAQADTGKKDHSTILMISSQ